MPHKLSRRDYEALAELRHRLRRFLAFSEDAARRAGLEPRQHQLMLAVHASAEPPTLTALARRLVLAHHSVVGLVDRLEKKRLVARTRSTFDRRIAHVSLTKRGAALIERLSVSHHDELRRAAPALVEALEHLSP